MIDLFIAGHGKNLNTGYFDAGATGYISKGEHRYMVEDLFPAMKKYLPDGAKAIFHTRYNVYSHQDIVSLAKRYGSDVRVTEFHFDAGGVNYSKAGGHVIIQSGLQPDELDLKLRNAIKNTVGLHPNYSDGISKRDNLQNPRLAMKGGINYRLLELGMSTHKENANYMIKNVDTIAKELVKAFYGTTKNDDKSNDKLYRVQVGAFKKLENAKKLQNELRKKGYTDSFII